MTINICLKRKIYKDIIVSTVYGKLLDYLLKIRSLCFNSEYSRDTAEIKYRWRDEGWFLRCGIPESDRDVRMPSADTPETLLTKLITVD